MSNFCSFRELITNSNLAGGFQLNYWDLYLNRSHVVVKKLLEAQQQIYEKRFSTSPLKSTTTESSISRTSVNPISTGTTAYVSVPSGTYGAAPTTTISYVPATGSPSKTTTTYTTTTTDYSSLANKIQSTNVTGGTNYVKVEGSPYSKFFF